MNLRTSVRAQLLCAFGIVILAFSGAVALGMYRLADYDSTVTGITGPELDKVEMADEWEMTISESMRHMRNMLILDDQAKIQEEVDAVKGTFEKRKAYAARMTALVRSAEGSRLLQAVLEKRAANLPIEEEFLQQVESGHLKEAKETMLQRARPAQLALIAALAKLGDHQRARIHEEAIALARDYQRGRTLLILISVGAAALACALATLITRSITNPLRQAVGALAEIERGNYAAPVVVRSHAEPGQVLIALNRMQSRLKERTEHDRAMAMENARVRTALDRVSVGVMLADPDGKIIYLNDSVRDLFRRQAAEIRQQLPRFDPDGILGSSFDVFHREPARQRSLLQRLTTTHTADMKLGRATLRIVANPVTDDAGARLGTVVQWADRTQEVATEDEVQTAVTNAIDGDLTSRITEAGKDPFFQRLAQGMNQLLGNMADVIRTMTLAAAEVRAGTEEISRGNVNLSQRTEEQAASLEETASSMEQMTSTVKHNADNAAQANQLALAARAHAERGGAVVQSAVSAMSAIDASSRRIADIIGVIDELAFQTNLLALNAAVEAARAGEQGRGFAVVASEVRNLASRSAGAAKEIKALIQDSVAKVSDGTKLVGESGEVLDEIVTGVKKVTDVVAEIAAASQEQASGIEQVNKAVLTMDETTQQNAALVEEAAAAAQALSEQAGVLSRMMERYRVGDGQTAAAAALQGAASTSSEGGGAILGGARHSHRPSRVANG